MIASTLGCPSAEELAAYLDGRLPAARAREIAEHALSCTECSEMVEGVVSARLDGVLQAPAKPGAHAIRWVAAAAAVVVTCVVGWVVFRSIQPGGDRAIAELVEASRGQRLVEARLTGGFEPGVVTRGPGSGGPERWKVAAVAEDLKNRLPGEPSASQSHAFGIAQLLMGSQDEAIRFLEEAVADAPKEPRYKVDLGGALLERAQAGSRPEDITRALAVVEEALRSDPKLEEGLFNKALALERMNLLEPAEQAWEAYLAADPDPKWAEEVRAHLNRLKLRPPA